MRRDDRSSRADRTFGATTEFAGAGDSRDLARVTVTGELDIATVPQLEHALLDAERRAPRLVLDLRALHFMDSSGVHAIVAANSRATARSGQLMLVPGPAQVARLLRLTGAEQFLSFIDPIDARRIGVAA